MPIRRKQICALEDGDVIFLDVPFVGRCCTAVLERTGSKLVLSLGAEKAEHILPVRDPNWEYLTIDEAGNICDKDGGDITANFLGGEILMGRAMDASSKYRARIMPDINLVRDGVVRFQLDPRRTHERNCIISKIRYMVMNDDYKGNHAMVFEMFAQLIKGAPIQELPVYMSVLINAISVLSQIKEVICSYGAEAEPEEVPLSSEASDLMSRVSRKTS